MRHAVVIGVALGLFACGGTETGKTSGPGGTKHTGGVSNAFDASGLATGGSLPCAPGNETCPCYGNGTCNGSLTCASNLCVQLGTGGGPGTGGAGGTGSANALDGGAAAATGAGGIAVDSWFCATTTANGQCVCVQNTPGTPTYDNCSTPKPACCAFATTPIVACVCGDYQGADCTSFVAANGTAVETCPPSGGAAAGDGGVQCMAESGFCDGKKSVCCPGLACVPEDFGGFSASVCASPCNTANDCATGCCTTLTAGGPTVCGPSQDCSAACVVAGTACQDDPGSCCSDSTCVFDDPSQTTAHCLKTCASDSQCTSNCCAPLELGSAVCEDPIYCQD